MSLNNSNINGHLVPETISLKESEVILTYNTDNNFYSLKENLTVIPESAEEYLDYIVTEGKNIITYDKSSGLIKIKEGVTEGFGIITIKSKFPTKVKAELKIYVTKSQTIEIFNDIYHIDKYGSLFIDDRELKEVGKVKSIEVGIETVYAITLDDRLYAWGYNSSGQVGNDSSKEQTTPYEIKEVGKVKSIEVGYTVYAITEDNRLYAWGDNSSGQVCNGKSGLKEKQTTPYEIKEVGKVKSIKVYEYEYAITVYAITLDNRLYAWGYNWYGQVGNGSTEYQTTPYEIKEVGKVKSIEVGYTVYAITEDNRLYAWGDNEYGQVGNGSTEYQTTPYEIKEVGKVKSIEVGSTVYAITEDDRLYAWGYNRYGQVGNGKSGYKEEQTTPYEVKEVGKVKSIEVYKYVNNNSFYDEKVLTVYTITEDNRLYAWGKNIQDTPYEFKEIGKIKSFEEKEGNFYLTTIDDRLFTWGKDGKVGNGAIPYEIKEEGAYKWVEEYNGTFYAITEDNRLYAWGNNYFGQVGNGKSGYNEYQTTPYEIKEVGKVKSIKVYEYYNYNEKLLTIYAITEDDRLYAWGYNYYGLVGNGKSGYNEYQTTPYEIKEVGKVKSIKVYEDEKVLTIYAITEDDRLYAWGNNEYGQVGNGSRGEQTTPYETKEVGKVKSIKVYEYYNYNKKLLTIYAITEDDRLYAWGGNIQNTPYEFKEIGKIKSFEEKAGNFYLTTIDDRLFTWGKDSKVGNDAIPYEIKEVEAYKWVKEYKGTFYAITEDDRLYTWGNNYLGQVGNGSSKVQTIPYEIKEVGKVKSIEIYEYEYKYRYSVKHTYKTRYTHDYNEYCALNDDNVIFWALTDEEKKCNLLSVIYPDREVYEDKYEYKNELSVYAITEDDRLYAWGGNHWGQVGNGSSKVQTTPYEIKEVGKIKSIEVYKNKDKLTVYAITLDDSLYAWGNNEYGQVGNGSTEYQTTPYEIKEVGKVKSIKVYEYEYAITVYAITEDDRLYAWGDNYDGQIGNGKSGDGEEQTTPYEIKEVGKVKSIEVYEYYHHDYSKEVLTIYAITEDDRLYAWGNNYYGQIGSFFRVKYDETTPYEIKEVGKVKLIKVGFGTIYAITEDDRLYAWGSNYCCQVGNDSYKEQRTPYEIKEVGKVKSIKVYEYEYAITVYAIIEDDRLYAWGDNEYGQVGNSSTKPQTTPYEVKEVGKVKSIKVYNKTVYAITEDDRLYAWGYNIQNTPYEFKEIGKIKSFEEKAGNFYLSTIDDRLFTWGEDSKVGNGAIPYEIKEVE